MNYSKYFCLCLILFISIKTVGQEHIYENFGVDDGLPSSEVYDTYQDKEGYIWFATDKGLSRYNGYEFENFNTTDGLTGNVVLRLYPQQNGQVWCYSFHNKSLFYFDEIFNGFKQYKHNKILNKKFHKTSGVKSVYLDEENSLHIGGRDINGEIVISIDGIKSVQHSSEKYYTDTIIRQRIALKTQSVISFFTELVNNPKDTNYFYNDLSSAHIMAKWLMVNETAVFMTNGCVVLTFKDQEKKVIKSNYSPIGIEIIDEDHFFIGYQFGGGKIVNRKGRILKEFLSDQSVTSFMIDHEGGYWFTTLSSGVFYIKNPSILSYSSDKTLSHHVNSLVKTNDNDLLIGYKNGAISNLTNNRMTSLYEQPECTTHAFVEYDSTLDRIYTYSNEELKENQNINGLFKKYILKFSEPKDKTLFATNNNRYYKIKEDRSVIEYRSPYRVYDLCVWNNDTLIATPLGLFKVIKNKYISLSDQSKLFGFRSDDIDVNDVKDILYVATQGAGVVTHNGNSISSITENDGLYSNIINEIHIENDSTIWACTNRGINRIIWSEDGMMISGMSKKDGLLSNEVEDIEIINDTVWIGTRQGLCSFPKDQLNLKKIDIPFLKLKDVIVNNVSLKSLSNPSLTYKENEIDFVLEGISYKNKNNLYYQFRINKDLNWSSTQNREIHFSALSAGNYFFEAKLCVDNLICSDKIITYAFTIQAPFWKRGWFRFLCLCLFGMLVYSFFKIRVLTYNKDITREFIRLLVKRLKRKEMYFSFRENGNQIRIKTHEILFVKSAGNYIDVHTENKTYTIRMNIGKFLDNVPDKLEYVRLHRSYIARIDKITTKSKNEVQLSNDIKIPVSLNYHKSLKEVLF